MIRKQIRPCLSYLWQPGGGAGVCVLTVGLLVVGVGLTQEQLVLAPAEGVPEEGHWLEEHVRVVALGLTSARAIKVPPGTV